LFIFDHQKILVDDFADVDATWFGVGLSEFAMTERRPKSSAIMGLQSWWTYSLLGLV
jgi:hypothetical protein